MKVFKKIAKTNIPLFSLFLSIIYFIIKLLFNIIKELFKIPDTSFREKLIDENFSVIINLLLDTLIIAPIVETLIFQALFYKIYQKAKINKWIIMAISSIAFGLFHYYSLFYILSTTVAGFIFVYMYFLRAEINNKPLLSTICAHFTINLIVIINVMIAHYHKFGNWF